jgi:hypothetical protein
MVIGVLPFAACGRSDPESDLLDFHGLDSGVGGHGGTVTTGGKGGTSTGATGGVSGTGGSTGGVAGFGGFGGSSGVSGSGGIGALGGTGGISGGAGGFGAGGAGGSTGGFGGAPKDGGNFFDAFPFPDSGPIADCLSCAGQHCATQVNKCYNNSSCALGVVCAITACNGFNLGCIFQCFNGNFQAAFQAFQAFACVAGNCGQECIGAFFGGGGGGGPTPPPPPPGGGPASPNASLSPRAGGSYGYITQDVANATGIPEGWVYIPPLEVWDAMKPQ